MLPMLSIGWGLTWLIFIIVCLVTQCMKICVKMMGRNPTLAINTLHVRLGEYYVPPFKLFCVLSC